MINNLFDFYEIKNLKLKNRFVLAAAGGGDTGDAEGNILDKEIERYVKIAKGGVGLLETGGIGVHPHGVFSMVKAHIFNDAVIPSFKKLTDKIHQENAKIAAQIYHNGAFAGAGLKGQGIKAISASKADNAYPYKKHFFVDNYREATDEDLAEVIEAFGEAAKRVKSAGFDAVVVHGCHDTLLAQFLSPATNKRNDQWGGSLENRLRLHVEILKAIRKTVGNDFCIIIKLGIVEPYESGLTFDEGKQAAKILHQTGYDIIEISQGQNGLNWEETCLRQKVNKPSLEGYFRKYCQEIHALGIPTILTGGLRSYEVIEDIMKNNETDLIGLCRPLIKNPYLISDWQQGNHVRSDCTSCNKCVMAIMQSMPLRCYLHEKGGSI